MQGSVGWVQKVRFATELSSGGQKIFKKNVLILLSPKTLTLVPQRNSSIMAAVFARTTQNVTEEKRRNAFRDIFCKTILVGTKDDGSPLSKLAALPGVQQKIFEFAAPLPLDSRQFHIKIRLFTCAGSEGVFVERLTHPNYPIGLGSLSNNLICGSQWTITKPFLRMHAHTKNEDGSYLNEGQLRARWKTFNLEHFCESPSGRCKGICGALPGDTIFFECDEMMESTGYCPATQEDIVERGWNMHCAPGHGPSGPLEAQARIARDDPSQLESDEEE